MDAVTVTLAGEELCARADKSLYWPSRQTLFVADLHLGKGAAFRAGRIPVPPGSTAATLEALSRSLDETGARRLAILGDLWHSREGRDPGTRARFAEWRARHAEVEMLLVVGNHDAKSGPLENEGFDVQKGPVAEDPFCLRHEPPTSPDQVHALCGHLHPCVTLEGKGRQSLRLPCFWLGSSYSVLPSFGWFTGCAEVRPIEGDQVIVLAENRAFRVA